jgi:AbrB family looped-hinge helix DNA binding protein
MSMITMRAARAVKFTTKGQVVIPLGLRKYFHIEKGTRAIVAATSEGILLKPVTQWAIRQGYGLLKRKGSGRTFVDDRASHKREELAIEEGKYARCSSAR